MKPVLVAVLSLFCEAIPALLNRGWEPVWRPPRTPMVPKACEKKVFLKISNTPHTITNVPTAIADSVRTDTLSVKVIFRGKLVRSALWFVVKAKYQAKSNRLAPLSLQAVWPSPACWLRFLPSCWLWSVWFSLWTMPAGMTASGLMLPLISNPTVRLRNIRIICCRWTTNISVGRLLTKNLPPQWWTT